MGAWKFEDTEDRLDNWRVQTISSIPDWTSRRNILENICGTSPRLPLVPVGCGFRWLLLLFFLWLLLWNVGVEVDSGANAGNTELLRLICVLQWCTSNARVIFQYWTCWNATVDGKNFANILTQFFGTSFAQNFGIRCLPGDTRTFSQAPWWF